MSYNPFEASEQSSHKGRVMSSNVGIKVSKVNKNWGIGDCPSNYTGKTRDQIPTMNG
jgi:hypothetical protein